MAEKRISNEIINKEDVDYLLNITEEEGTTTSFFMKTFGSIKGKRRFNPYDTITIPPGQYGEEGKKNKNSFKTTVGLWVFNKVFLEKDLHHIVGYINSPVNGDTIGDISTKLSYWLMEDKVSIDIIKRFQMKLQKYMSYVSIISSSYTMKMITVGSEIEKKKKELIKKYDSRIKAGDEKAVDEMEKELLAYAKDYLDGDPAMDMYNSEAKGNFKNHFKNLFVMKGVIKNPDPTKGYDFSMGSYMNGISKDEYSIIANSLTAGPYARAKKTEVGGYWEKLFVSAFQHIVADKPGSDCGTKRYITVTLDKFNMKNFMYSYIIEGSKLVELTSENMDHYKGKEVKLRFSSLCESKSGICNKCLGNLFNRLGLTAIGLATPQIPAKFKLASMKAFHDSTVKFGNIDIDKAFNS